MDRESMKEEEDRRKKEEEARRRASIKKWLSSRKEKLKIERNNTNKQRLGPVSLGEGGDTLLHAQQKFSIQK